MAQEWQDLLFAHWPIPAAVLRPLVPRELEVEEFDGTGWLGIVPFRLRNLWRRVPGRMFKLSFVELNVRTYVRVGDRPGVFFFSLDAASPLAVAGARLLFRLPYYPARMSCTADEGWVRYRSRRLGGGAELRARYRPTGEVFHARAGTLDYFLTERYCLYAVPHPGRVLRVEIDHPPWPLQPAELEITRNTMTRPLGITLPEAPPLLHFSRRQEVVNWGPVRVG